MGGGHHHRAVPVIASGLKTIPTAIPNYFTAAWQRYLCSPHQRGFKSSTRVLCRGLQTGHFASLFNQPRRYQQLLPWVTLIQGDLSVESEAARGQELANKGATKFEGRVNIGSTDVYTEGYKCQVQLEAPGNQSHRIALRFNKPDLYGGIEKVELNLHIQPRSAVSEDELHNAAVLAKDAKTNFTVIDKYTNIPPLTGLTKDDSVLSLDVNFTFHRRLKYVHADHIRNLFRTWTEMTLEGFMLDSREFVNPEVLGANTVGDKTSHFIVLDYKEESDDVNYDLLPLHETHTFNYQPPSWCTW